MSGKRIAAQVAGAAQVARHTLESWAIHLVRSIRDHNNGGGIAFLQDPAPFLAPETRMTTAQLCNLFNFSMSLCGVGLKMPTDSQGEKVWDRETFERGVALAKGRQVTPNQWVSQKYQPLKVPGRDNMRSFYTGLTEAARVGMLADVDSTPFKSLSGDDLREALKEWFGRVVGDGKTPGTLTGSADKPGPLAYSFRSVAVRADLPADGGKRKGSKRNTVTAESLLAEYGQA